MSKRVGAEITCPRCSTVFPVSLYRSIWIEDAANRELVFSDSVNVVTCPGCDSSMKLPVSLLCTNVGRQIAVWYEPRPDPAVEADIQQYRQHFGANSFYAQAPRLRDWEEFKKTILEFESRPVPKDSPRLAPKGEAMMRDFMDHATRDSKKSRGGLLSRIRKFLGA